VPSASRHTRTVPVPLTMAGVPYGSAPTAAAVTPPSWPAGDAVAARDQFAALVPVRERVSGPEHPDTLIVRQELAHWTGVTGNWADARDQYAALVPACERVSGPEHPDTLRARHELARWTRRATATD
jgi:Tetratricopeptide repeat